MSALLQHLPSYLGFSYLGCGVSLHGCSGKAQSRAWAAAMGHGAQAAATVHRPHPRGTTPCPRSGDRMGKTRDLFKKIRDTKGTFHAKMGSIKDRNGMDLAEAVDIKKRWKDYTEELYKKDLHHQDNHHGVITHLQPDILECEVKWALESITTNKASGGDGIPVELFQILKDDAVKVLYSICQQSWKTTVAPGKFSSGHLEKQAFSRTGKGQFSFQCQSKVMQKNAQTTVQLYSYHTLVK